MPIALKGGNIIGQAGSRHGTLKITGDTWRPFERQARNGSGKTAAFALAAILAKLPTHDRMISHDGPWSMVHGPWSMIHHGSMEL